MALIEQRIKGYQKNVGCKPYEVPDRKQDRFKQIQSKLDILTH